MTRPPDEEFQLLTEQEKQDAQLEVALDHSTWTAEVLSPEDDELAAVTAAAMQTATAALRRRPAYSRAAAPDGSPDSDDADEDWDADDEDEEEDTDDDEDGAGDEDEVGGPWHIVTHAWDTAVVCDTTGNKQSCHA